MQLYKVILTNNILNILILLAFGLNKVANSKSKIENPQTSNIIF